MGENRNGYELRAHMLSMAKDMLSERMHVSMDLKQQPVLFTTEDVLSEAEKLYAFVTNRQQ